MHALGGGRRSATKQRGRKGQAAMLCSNTDIEGRPLLPLLKLPSTIEALIVMMSYMTLIRVLDVCTAVDLFVDSTSSEGIVVRPVVLPGVTPA